MRLRHKTTAAVIGETQWNEDHVLAAWDFGDTSGPVALLTLHNGSVQTFTITRNVTIYLPPVQEGTTEHLTLILTNNATGGHAVTIPDVQWVGGTAPTFDTAAGAKNIVVLRGVNGTWIGDGGKFA